MIMKRKINDNLQNILILITMILYSYSFISIKIYFISATILIALLIINYRLSIKSFSLTLLLLLYFLIILIFYLNNSYFNYVEYFKSLFQFQTSLLLFIYLKTIVLSDKFYALLKTALYLILFLGFIQLLFSFFDIYFSYSNSVFNISNTPDIGFFTSNGIFRIKSIFSEPSWFAITSVTLMIILAGKNKLTTVDFVIIISGLLLTFSLTGILGVAIATVILFHNGVVDNSINFKSISKIFMLLITLFMLFIIIIPEESIAYMSDRVNLVISGEDASTQIRFTRASLMVEYIVKENPFIGAGLGNESLLAAKLGLTSVNSDIVYINNYYQYLFITTGFLGAFIFLSFFTYITIKDLRKFLRKKLHKRYLIILLVMYLVFNIFTNGFILTPIFWVPLGIIMSTIKYDIKTHNLLNSNYLTRQSNKVIKIPVE